MLGNTNIFNIKKNTIQYEYTKNNNKLLSFSLMWFSLAISLVLLFSLGVSFIEPMRDFFVNFFNVLGFSFWIIIPLVQIGLVFLINYLIYKNKSLFSIVLSFFIFVFIESIVVAFIFIVYSPNLAQNRNILLVLLIPFGILIFMGILGYFKIFNFSKILPILIFSTFALAITGILFWFILDDVLIVTYSFISVLLFSVWIGFDMYVIRRTSEEMSRVNNYTNSDYLKVSISFGLKLFLDFINILLSLIRIVGIFSR